MLIVSSVAIVSSSIAMGGEQPADDRFKFVSLSPIARTMIVPRVATVLDGVPRWKVGEDFIGGGVARVGDFWCRLRRFRGRPFRSLCNRRIIVVDFERW